jgi:hypothetical protein
VWGIDGSDSPKGAVGVGVLERAGDVGGVDVGDVGDGGVGDVGDVGVGGVGGRLINRFRGFALLHSVWSNGRDRFGIRLARSHTLCVKLRGYHF